ncbi:MAG TPA: tetratricopeptide repeat protein [Solirubrobacteraceae bacterium]|nr:tetratricopeptide repeat protein [Solirubrobacteraceae bacterium]
MLYYNLACSEVALGRVDDALADLRRAVEMAPPLGEFARADEDLAAIREEPGFAEITAAHGAG